MNLRDIKILQKCWALVLTSTIILALQAGHDTVAQVDPDPDMISIYFDEAATLYCTTAPVGEPVTAFLCLTNCTALAGIAGWEATIEVTAGVPILDWLLRGEAINVSTPPEFTVGLVDGLPWSPSIVLLEFTVGVYSPDPIELRVAPIPGPPIPPWPCPLPLFAAWDGGGVVQTLGYAAGWDLVSCQPNVCAIINGDCNVLAEAEPTWGQVKAMYR
jgi:hypothetical protein